MLKPLRQNPFYIYLLSLAALLSALFIEFRYHQKTQANANNPTAITELIHQKEAFLRMAVQTMIDEESGGYDMQKKLRDFAYEEKVFVQGYYQDSIIFWNSNLLSFENLQHKSSGMSIEKCSNGWYLLYRVDKGRFSYVSFFLLKQEYAFQNNYLQNEFNPELKDQYSEESIFRNSPAAGYADLVSLSGKYLASALLVNKQTAIPSGISLLTVLSILFFLVAIFRCTNQLLDTRPQWALIFLPLNFILLRLLCLQFHFPDLLYKTPLFGSEVYATPSQVSLGDFLINSLMLLSVIIYLSRLLKLQETHFRVIRSWSIRKQEGLAFLIILSNILYTEFVLKKMQSLIIDSSISFDVNMVYQTGFYYFICILITGALFYSHIIIADESIKLLKQFSLTLRWIFLCCLFITILFIAFEAIDKNFNSQYLTLLLIYLITVVITPLLSADLVWYQRTLGIIIVISLFSANYIFFWNNEKEKENRKLYAFKLTARNDIDVEYHFREVENKIASDPLIRDYFKNSIILKSQLELLVKKSYFAGYLGRYNVLLFDYDSSGVAYKEINSLGYYDIDSIYNYFSVKTVNEKFRYIKNTAELQGYLGRFYINDFGRNIGILYILLQPKLVQEENRFDELLVEGKTSFLTKNSNYSYAIYKNHNLLDQSGTYVYPVSIRDIDANMKNSFHNEEGYSHLLFSENEQITILISKKQDQLNELLAIFSVLFVVYTSLALIVFSFLMLFSVSLNFLEQHVSRNRFLNRMHSMMNRIFPMEQFRLNLISTKIQISIIVIVFPTLLLTSYFTLDSMREKYEKRQFEKLARKTVSVVKTIENDKRISVDRMSNEDLASIISQVADYNNTDINIYSPEGRLLSTTTSRIYDDGIMAPLMNVNALYTLKVIGKSQHYQTENIGNIRFLAAYVPLLNNRKQIVAYLNVPYFTQESEQYDEITSLFISIINVYVIAFLSVILIVYIISRNLTAPLLLIREKMASTTLGRKNEMIEWKGNDEIASLVNQYNLMIEELARSAEKLARSEREDAWREMAKQVAHEIKNPLTPMKLSVQHLQRAWTDHSPSLEETFKRVTSVLIEQIDSMSVLATEFSSFAKLPSSRYQPVNAIETLNSVVDLYKENGQVNLYCKLHKTAAIVLLDKDQLMRVFNNLLKNAIQAIPEEREGKIFIESRLNGNYLNISIQDNGSGIAPEQQEKIFLPNFSTKNSGMGLGLAIVKNIIENAGGSIYFETEQDKGTTFYVILPLHDA